MRSTLPPEELAAATEWRAADEALAAIKERLRKTGDVPPDDYTAAWQRVEDAAAAITIPGHLMTFNADDWPGRAGDQTGMTIDPLRRREQHRQAQDAWVIERKLWRGDFEELQARQKARQDQQAAAPKKGGRRARARSTTK